jgi:MFS transporter, FSR family, fosmidomycin resistance protein
VGTGRPWPQVYAGDRRALPTGVLPTRGTPPAMTNYRAVLANGALLALMLGHFTNDMFAGVLPILYPLAQERFRIDNAAVGLITLAYAGSSSLFQPLFGLLADRFVARWLPPAILLWSAAFVASYGLAGSYAQLVLLAALAGIGSAAYHPLGASSAALVSDPRTRNSSLSLYTVAGTSGYALGPIIAALLLSLYGVRGTVWFLVPGLLGAGLLWARMGRVVRQQRVAAQAGLAGGNVPWSELGRVVLVVMLRSWSFLALLQFVPLWFDDRGYGRSFYGPLSTTIILAGVAGTIVGGVLADRLGGRAVIVGSQALCIPALLLFAAFPGPMSFVSGAMFGFCSDASLAVTLGAAQRLLPGRTGVASGVILGLGFITGGIGVPVTGAIADRAGYADAMRLLMVLCAGAALVALSIRAAVFRPEPLTTDLAPAG